MMSISHLEKLPLKSPAVIPLYLLLFLIICPSDAIANTSLTNALQASPTLPEKNTLAYALSQGSFKGLLRYSGQYRDSNLHIAQDNNDNIVNNKQQQYSAIGGYLGYETAAIFNTSIGATLYTSQPFGNNPDDRRGLGGLYENNGKQQSYSVFGEVFAQFKSQNHLLKIGRQEMPDYRFVSLSNIRMTPLTHEGIVYENTHFQYLKLNFAYITKMKERNAEKFIDMAQAARVKISNSGKQVIRGRYDSTNYANNEYIGDKKEMSMFGLNYNDTQVSLEGWNYFINDFLNTSYLYGQYNLSPEESDFIFSLSAQYARQTDVGKRIAGNIDTWFYGLKFQTTIKQTSFFIAYNEVAYNENSYDGGSIFVRWGTPQMFNSFQVQDSELAGTKSTGLGVQHRFSQSSLIPGVIMRLRYGIYNMPDKLSQKDARQDRTETTLDINYAFNKAATLGDIPLKGLSVQFRLAYNDYDTDYDFVAYKNIHNYDFASVTDDFIDARLYLDYQF